MAPPPIRGGPFQMSLLRSLETKIEGLVEGTFGRVFRSEVRPIELARKLLREMDEHRTVSLSRVYAPHEYDLWLSGQDRQRYAGIEAEVADELGAYLMEHARREQLVLAARPVIRIHTDNTLELGEFGIETHPVSLPAPDARADASQGGAPEREPARRSRSAGANAGEDVSSTMIYSGARRLSEPLEQSPTRRAGALLVLDGRRLVLGGGGGIVGRSRECDVVLSDTGVSRRHAEIRPGADGWTIEDLGSTNGVRVSGRPVHGVWPLHEGDQIELGSTKIVFELR